MLFDSYQFVLFLPVVLAVYFGCASGYRWAVLLIASYIFYMAWEPAYAILILTSTLMDYFVAGLMGGSTNRRVRRLLLAVSLMTNLGLLSAFKYFDFIRTTLNDITHYAGFSATVPALDVLLPVGISFYTFQTLRLLYFSVVLSRSLRGKMAGVISGVEGSRLQTAYQWFITFVGVNAAWVFFRAESLPDAITIFPEFRLAGPST